MPVKLSVNYTLAFDLFARGLTFREIAQQVGCKQGSLRQYARRNNWTQQVSQTRQAVSQVVQNMVLREPQTIQKRAEQWVDATACDIERTVATLSKLPVPDNLDGLRKHEEVWGMHVKRGRQTFGLDNQSQSITLNVGLVSHQDLLPQPEPIDITPSTSTESSTEQP